MMAILSSMRIGCGMVALQMALSHAQPQDVHACEATLVRRCAQTRGLANHACHACASVASVQNCTAADLAAFCAHPGIDPLHRQELTVFHINPSYYQDSPADMNSGDAAGDMFWALQNVFQPFICHDRSSPIINQSLTCTNAEVADPDLVVTKLRLQVDDRFGAYETCNICVNGHDPLFVPPPPPASHIQCRSSVGVGQAATITTCSTGAHCAKIKMNRPDSSALLLQGCDSLIAGICSKVNEPADQCFRVGNISIICSGANEDFATELSSPEFESCLRYSSLPHPVIGRNCTNGEYVCDCPSGDCDPIKVGSHKVWDVSDAADNRAAIEKFITTSTTHGVTFPQIITKNMTSWYQKLAQKLGGAWYSTRKAGMCTDQGQRCGWQLLETVKRVSKSCLDNSVFSYIEGKDQTGCFDACAIPRDGTVRNTSDECWARCLFVTVLGPDAGFDITTDSRSGLSREELLEAWARPFASENPALGGCLALAPPTPLTTTTEPLHVSAGRTTTAATIAEQEQRQPQFHLAQYLTSCWAMFPVGFICAVTMTVWWRRNRGRRAKLQSSVDDSWLMPAVNPVNHEVKRFPSLDIDPDESLNYWPLPERSSPRSPRLSGYLGS